MALFLKHASFIFLGGGGGTSGGGWWGGGGELTIKAAALIPFISRNCAESPFICFYAVENNVFFIIN